MRETRGALAAWARRPLPVVARWGLAALAIALLLLAATLAVAAASNADAYREPIGLFERSPADLAFVVGRNLLVLTLHVLVCVATYLARRQLPLQANLRRGVDRWIHAHAGPAALVFVAGATALSLTLQAVALGHAVREVAGSFDVSSLTVVLGVLPHALPELAAVFLPLAACILLGRAGRWNETLAAAFATAAVALPVIAISAAVEVYASPHLLRGLLV